MGELFGVILDGVVLEPFWIIKSELPQQVRRNVKISSDVSIHTCYNTFRNLNKCYVKTA